MPLIPGATAISYELQPEDVGFNIFCRVRGTNAAGFDIGQSNTVGPVVSSGTAPSITVAPEVTVSLDGTTVTSSSGTWAGTPAPTFGYQWYSDETPDVAISGAISATYVIDGGVIEEALTFTPADLPGLIAWYKADTGVYSDAGTTPIVDGGWVAQWNNQVAGGQHLLQPTTPSTLGWQYDTTGFNTSHPGISCDFTSRFLATPADTVAHGGGSALSVFVVCSLGPGLATNGRLIVYLGNGVAEGNDYLDAGSGIALIATNSTHMGAMRGSPGGTPKAVVTVAEGTNYRLGSIFDGANHEMYLNNTASGTPVAATGAFTSPGRLILGISGDSIIATIAEIVVTNTALDSTQRTDLDNYFKAKWGLT